MINIKSRISTTPSSPKETKMSEYTINYSIDGWPICKNGEPIYGNKAMLAELRQLQARIKELEEELATTRAGWQETIAIMASQERPAYDEQQQRIAKLEAVKLGLTKTLIEMEAERANNLCHACAHTQNDIGWFRVNLSDDDVRDLLRFRDECHDDGTFTLRSDQTRRFCGMGVMQWRGRAGYSLTSIGEEVLSRAGVLHDNQ